tara:strand:- start:179 stop:361 length:183 start_codon:yes stop_codon:yes gene_type:complete
MKVGDLIKFKASGVLATIVKHCVLHGDDFEIVAHGGGYKGRTWLSRNMAMRTAEIISEAG